MNKFNTFTAISAIISIASATTLVACDFQSANSTPKSSSGATKMTVKIPLNAKGKTTEQENIANRLLTDNAPGAIKHLYIISAYSGQVIIYSTVSGKVTSSGKRLSPTSAVDAYDSINDGCSGFVVDIGGDNKCTSEVLQDDGTYGSAIEYLYWWDAKGAYHQHYVTGGQIPHISDQPLAVKSVIINIE